MFVFQVILTCWPVMLPLLEALAISPLFSGDDFLLLLLASVTSECILLLKYCTVCMLTKDEHF